MNIEAGSVVTFKWLERELTGVIIHDVRDEDGDVYCKIRTRRTSFKVPSSDITSQRPPDPYVPKPKGQSLRTRLSWYLDSANLHGETWKIHRDQRGGRDTTWLEFPQWAQDVAFKHEVNTRLTGYGRKKELRELAQHIVDLAIQDGTYPFELPRA